MQKIEDLYGQISVNVLGSTYFDGFHPFLPRGFESVLDHCRSRKDGLEWGIFADIGGIIPGTNDMYVTERRLLACSKGYRLPEHVHYPDIQLDRG